MLPSHVISDPDARHRHDHTRLTHVFGHTHPDLERDAVHDAEQTFDRLNPDFGVPADQRSHCGRQAVRDREAALALGCGWPSTTAARTTGTRSSGSPARTTGPPTPSRPPVAIRSGPADAIQTARSDPVRTRRGPERTGSER
jgi:hypothetical protein